MNAATVVSKEHILFHVTVVSIQGLMASEYVKLHSYSHLNCSNIYKANAKGVSIFRLNAVFLSMIKSCQVFCLTVGSSYCYSKLKFYQAEKYDFCKFTTSPFANEALKHLQDWTFRKSINTFVWIKQGQNLCSRWNTPTDLVRKNSWTSHIYAI